MQYIQVYIYIYILYIYIIYTCIYGTLKIDRLIDFSFPKWHVQSREKKNTKMKEFEKRTKYSHKTSMYNFL